MTLYYDVNALWFYKQFKKKSRKKSFYNCLFLGGNKLSQECSFINSSCSKWWILTSEYSFNRNWTYLISIINQANALYTNEAHISSLSIPYRRHTLSNIQIRMHSTETNGHNERQIKNSEKYKINKTRPNRNTNTNEWINKFTMYQRPEHKSQIKNY